MIRMTGLLLVALLSLHGYPQESAEKAASAVNPDVLNTLQPVEFLDLKSYVPEGWSRQPNASNMRLAQFNVPGGNTSESAEFILFYFGPGQGGTPAANVSRWRSQFSSPQGGPVEAIVKTQTVGNMPVTSVELTGDYARGVGMGASTATPDQTLLASILETPRGNVYIQLHGPRKTVESHKAAYQAFIQSVE